MRALLLEFGDFFLPIMPSTARMTKNDRMHARRRVPFHYTAATSPSRTAQLQPNTFGCVAWFRPDWHNSHSLVAFTYSPVRAQVAGWVRLPSRSWVASRYRNDDNMSHIYLSKSRHLSSSRFWWEDRSHLLPLLYHLSCSVLSPDFSLHRSFAKSNVCCNGYPNDCQKRNPACFPIPYAQNTQKQ